MTAQDDAGQALYQRIGLIAGPIAALIAALRAALALPAARGEESAHIEKFFWGPTSVKLDESGRVYVTESNRHRVQIFERVVDI